MGVVCWGMFRSGMVGCDMLRFGMGKPQRCGYGEFWCGNVGMGETRSGETRCVPVR